MSNDLADTALFCRTPDELLVVLSLNNAHFQKGYVFEHPSIPEGKWTEILNSDLSVYGGTVVIGNHNIESAAGRIEVFVPANSVLVMKRN